MTLAEQFAASRGRPIEVDGFEVHCIYRRALADGDELVIRRIACGREPVSGLRLKVRGGSFDVGGRMLKEVVLWADESPDEVRLLCRTDEVNAEVSLWNCWRDEQGGMHAWLGDAGMAVDEGDDVAVLRCSAGANGFDPTALIVAIAFLH